MTEYSSVQSGVLAQRRVLPGQACQYLFCLLWHQASGPPASPCRHSGMWRWLTRDTRMSLSGTLLSGACKAVLTSRGWTDRSSRSLAFHPQHLYAGELCSPGPNACSQQTNKVQGLQPALAPASVRVQQL